MHPFFSRLRSVRAEGTPAGLTVARRSKAQPQEASWLPPSTPILQERWPRVSGFSPPFARSLSADLLLLSQPVLLPRTPLLPSPSQPSLAPQAESLTHAAVCSELFLSPGTWASVSCLQAPPQATDLSSSSNCPPKAGQIPSFLMGTHKIPIACRDETKFLSSRKTTPFPGSANSEAQAGTSVLSSSLHWASRARETPLYPDLSRELGLAVSKPVSGVGGVLGMCPDSEATDPRLRTT